MSKAMSTPLLTNWSHQHLALSHWYDFFTLIWSVPQKWPIIVTKISKSEVNQLWLEPMHHQEWYFFTYFFSDCMWMWHRISTLVTYKLTTKPLKPAAYLNIFKSNGHIKRWVTFYPIITCHQYFIGNFNSKKILYCTLLLYKRQTWSQHACYRWNKQSICRQLLAREWIMEKI